MASASVTTTALVIFTPVTHFPQAFLVQATRNEIHMLEMINNKGEGECYNESMCVRMFHYAVMHFLGKAAFYDDEEGFNAQILEWQEEGDHERHLSRLIHWRNYGKWSRGALTTNDCTGAQKFYHVHVDV
jgi:hypothetical protein